MTREQIKSSIEFFFDVIEGDHAIEEREERLRLALDQLALAIHFADYTFDEKHYPDAPTREYAVVREIVSANFPNLGYYNSAHEISEKIAESSLDVGDAIDDICDIAGHLEEALWCWDNTSVDDALWHLKEPFAWHWGKHLRDLQLYLFARQNGW